MTENVSSAGSRDRGISGVIFIQTAFKLRSFQILEKSKRLQVRASGNLPVCDG